jgi:hypothetical protein
MTKETIGFIGAGMMGSGIASSLLAAGHAVTLVAHRRRERIEALLEKGAREAATLDDLAGSVDVVMICVNSADDVETIVNRIEPRLATGQAIIDVTTSRPDTSQRLATRLATRGIAFLDAPVVGGPVQAAEGKLGTFVGALPGDFARFEPLLRRYSSEIIHFGPPGAGNTAKLLNNFLTVGLRQLITHTFRAARRNGIDEAKLYRMCRIGGANSRTLEQMVGPSLEGNYKGSQFSIANCLKDASYVGPLMAGDPDGAAIQQAIAAAYRRLVDAGEGERLSSEMLDPKVEAAARR